MWTAGTGAAVLLSGLVGLSLGLVGGGGSILTLPILVYVAGMPVPQAVTLSLAIVGATAAVGGMLHLKAGTADPKVAALFGVTGMVGAAVGARLTPLVPGPVLLTFFAGLMIAVGIRMLQGRSDEDVAAGASCTVWKCGLSGLGLGVLTGFLGVGGGFMIVPALLRFASMPMRKAVGTSLVIIAANSAAGFAAHAGELGRNFDVALAFAAAAVAGLLGGLRLASRMTPEGLKVAFGGIALVVAAYLLVRNLGPVGQMLSGRVTG